MAVKTYIAAITEALDLALERDENTLIFGEDVGQNGGYSVQLTGSKLNMGKTAFSTHLWLNLVSVV